MPSFRGGSAQRHQQRQRRQHARQKQHTVRKKVTKRSKPKQHRGQGGAWHAFVSKRHSGKKGRPDFAGLAREYNALADDDPEKIAAHAAGAAASFAARSSGYTLRGFGPRTSKLRLKAALVMRKAVLRAAGLTAADGDMPAATVGAARFACELGGDGLSSRVSAVTSWCHALAAARREDEDAEDHAVQAWIESSRDSHREWLAGALGVRGGEAPVCTPRPKFGGRCFETSFPSEEAGARLLAAFDDTSNPKIQREVAPAVDAIAQKRGGIILEDECPVVDDNEDVSDCRKFGLCICRPGHGRAVWSFRNSLYRALKRTLPHADPGKRRLLAKGYAVILLCGKKFDDDAEEPALALGSCDGSAGKGREFHALVQVGLHYWIPYRPTLHVLEFADPPPGEPPTTESRRYVKVMRLSGR